MDPKITIMVGTRPQIIKMVPLIRELESRGIDYDILHTGQHYSPSLSGDMFKLFDLPTPTYNLAVGSGNHYEQVGRIIESFGEYADKIKVAIISGDTNSALGCTIASRINNIPIIHIEAGVRSFDMSMPEEKNRVIIDQLSDYLFTPTLSAHQNLKNEGLDKKAVFIGDVMLDLLLQSIPFSTDILDTIGLATDTYAVLTLHRPFNVDDKQRFNIIVKELETTGNKYIFPAHPRVPKIISENIHVVEPLNYCDFMGIVSGASFIVTDSGGLQKEAYWLGKHCFTIRPNTEWFETLSSNILLEPEEISKTIFECDLNLFEPNLDMFGSGEASKRTVDNIIKLLRMVD